MSKPPSSSLPTQQEIQQWLFDELMETIQPELTSKNREKTVKMLSSLTPEQLRKKTDSYQESIMECSRRMPDFIRAKTEEMSALQKSMKVKTNAMAASAVENIEKQFHSTDTQS